MVRSVFGATSVKTGSPITPLVEDDLSITDDINSTMCLKR